MMRTMAEAGRDTLELNSTPRSTAATAPLSAARRGDSCDHRRRALLMEIRESFSTKVAAKLQRIRWVAGHPGPNGRSPPAYSLF